MDAYGTFHLGDGGYIAEGQGLSPPPSPPSSDRSLGSSEICLPGSLLLSDESDEDEAMCSNEMIIYSALVCAVVVAGGMFVYWGQSSSS